jgi:uncharacterized protein (DUF488 family)
MSQSIYTIGYEGVSINAVLKSLQEMEIDMLMDIRAVPQSRKPGFSKSKLGQFLVENEIEYIHLRGLGTPPEGREAARKKKKVELDRIYGQHLKTQDAKTDLKTALDLSQKKKCCLLCYEHSPACCHRLIVAEKIADRTGMEIIHLDPWRSQVLP